MPTALAHPTGPARAVSITDLAGALRSAWSPETAVLPSSWNERNRAEGQCAVTALIIQDFFGGDLIRAIVRPDVSHYWNKLPDGTELDLTRSFQRAEGALEKDVVSPKRLGNGEHVVTAPDHGRDGQLERRELRSREVQFGAIRELVPIVGHVRANDGSDE